MELIDKAFDSWRFDLKEEGTSKYIFENREGYLEDLVKLFIKLGVEYDDALMRSSINKVKDTIITKEGMKGRRNHTGWPERVEKDYREMLGHYYVDPDTSNIKPLEEIDKAPYWQFEDDSDGSIKTWVTTHYGYSDELYLEAKRVGSFFWSEYLEASFSI